MDLDSLSGWEITAATCAGVAVAVSNIQGRNSASSRPLRL